MLRQALLLTALLVALDARAADPTLAWQARLLDPSGAPLHGAHDVTVSLYEGGVDVWRKTFSATVADGYLSLTLGGPDDTGRTLDPAQLAADLLVGVAVDGAAELSPRMALYAVPRAASVVGFVRPLDTDAACTAEIEGALRWHDGALQVCDDRPAWADVYGSAPTITTVSLSSGAAGQPVSITGENFVPGQMSATIGGVSVPVGNVTATSLSYLSPVTALGQAATLELCNTVTSRCGSFAGAWTRTVRVQELLVSGTSATWTVPYPGAVLDIWAVGGGGAGGRSNRTGGSDESYGGGGGGGGIAVVRGYAVPVDVSTATFTVGAGTGPNNPNYGGTTNQCLVTPSGDGVSINGPAGGQTSISFAGSLSVTANGGGGGRGGPNGVGGGGGVAAVSGPGASGPTWGVATGGAGSSTNQGAGAPGGTITVAGATYRAAGGGGAGAGNQANPPSVGGSGDSASFTGGGGGGGADSPGAGGPGGTGYRDGGAGETASSGGGFAGGGGTFGGVVVSGGPGGATGIGRQVPGDTEAGRRNAGGGGGLFGGGGGGGGDSCSAGAGGGGQGVIVLSY